MKKKRTLKLVAALMLLTSLNHAQAEGGVNEISDIIVFGASYSDVGNLASANVSGFGPFALPPYFMGRLTNGWVWHEVMAEELGLTPASIPDEFHGNNYAWAGAEAGYGYADPVGIPRLGQQIANYLENQATLGQLPLSGDQLFILASAGANNLLPPGLPEDPDQIVAYIEEHISDLAAAGGRMFLVTNIVDLENSRFLEPGFLRPEILPPGIPSQEVADDILARAIEVNRKLRYRLRRLERQLDRMYGDVEVIHFDKYIVSRFVSRAGFLFGITNNTDPAMKAIIPGCFCTGGIKPGINPDQYFWFDSIHASARVHELLGYAAARAVRRNLRAKRHHW